MTATYRLPEVTIAQIDELASSRNMSATQAVITSVHLE